ncbi:MAG: CapA family protein, partial [FCB group bacterium]|nr:CapA family protein [FCB group bacterium]
MRKKKRYSLLPILLIYFSFSFSLPDTVSVIGVGDLMPGTSFPDGSYLPVRPERLLSHVKDIIQSADLAVANLEGCLIDSGGTPKDCWERTDRCFIFRIPEAYVHYIMDAGFDAVGLANNHVRDM